LPYLIHFSTFKLFLSYVDLTPSCGLSHRSMKQDVVCGLGEVNKFAKAVEVTYLTSASDCW
jgi:hypothetical protein